MPKRTRSRSVTTTSRKRTVTRSTRMKRVRRNVARSRISPASNVHSFSRWALPTQFNSVTNGGSMNFGSSLLYTPSTGVLTTNASTAGIRETAFSVQFQLADIPNPTEFSALYDQYKMCGAKFTIKMVNAPEATYVNNGSANSYTNFYPTLWYTRDYDDVGLLTLDEMRQYKTARKVVLRPNKEVSIFTKPRMLRQVFATTTGTGYEVAKTKFIDFANIVLPYYGLKACIDYEGQELPLSASTNQWRFRVNVKYYFMCKNVR